MKKLLILCFSLISISLFAQEDEEEKVFDHEGEKVLNFAIVDQKPVFPGCENLDKDENVTCFQEGIMNHIKRNFSYPKKARKDGTTGTIYVSFDLGRNGKIKNVKVIRGGNKSLEKEALRLVKSLPDMKPAHQRGKPIAINYVIPISFKLN